MVEEKIDVVAYSGYRGEETPREFMLRGRKIEGIEVLSRWIEEGAGGKAVKRCFKVKGRDGSIHTIHYDEDRKEWFCEVRGDPDLFWGAANGILIRRGSGTQDTDR